MFTSKCGWTETAYSMCLVIPHHFVQSSEIERLLDELTGRIRAWLDESEGEGPVTLAATPAEMRIRSRLVPPIEGEGIVGVLEGIDDFLKYSVRTHHRRFMNPLWSGFNASAFAGEVLTALAQNSMYTFELSPFATMVEQAIIKRMNEMIGFADGSGVLTTGGSNGNLLGTLCARHFSDPMTLQRGFDGSKHVIFVSAESHYSVLMAANVLGLGRSNVIKVACDNEGRMRPAVLAEEIAMARRADLIPLCIIATSGTTVRGAFDPLNEIADVAHAEGLWLHVDAAWGGACLFSKKFANLMDGVNRADSVCWDAHKMMGIPLVCSAFLVKDSKILRSVCSHTSNAPYLFHDTSQDFDLGRMSLQCGRRVDALKLWLAWREIGDAGWARKIEQNISMADLLEQMITQRAGMEMMSSRVWANVCFRLTPNEVPQEELDEFNSRLRELILRRGNYMISKAIIEDRQVLRPVITNLDVDEVTLEGLLDECEQCAKQLLSGQI